MHHMSVIVSQGMICGLTFLLLSHTHTLTHTQRERERERGTGTDNLEPLIQTLDDSSED